ncbi:MAG: (deoxy)nucleoside triphosphate pyrophosphohydrolase [Bacteroidales bacterium]|nr:(deoxy)nucleoside triphosphate pyrophosphohydrolase [Bacteroidales bacterium]
MTDVTCALIRNDEGLVLAVRRGPGLTNAGKWEFPGGKTRAGEDHEDCIIREIDEEMGMQIIITGRLDVVEYDYGDKQIRLIPFLCDTLASAPVLSEHDEFRWMKPDELPTLDLTAADIPVALQYAAEHRYEVIDEPETQEAIHTAEAGEEMARMMGRVSSVEEITMVAQSAARSESLLSQLVTLSSSTEKRVGFMSSWALSKVSDIDPAALSPYLAVMIDALPGVPNESVQRSFMRVIMRSRLNDIPLSHHARIIDYCMTIMREADTPVAPKAYGMEILAAFCSLYPDMVNEVAGLVQLAIADASGGMKAAGRKVIQRIGNKE